MGLEKTNHCENWLTRDTFQNTEYAACQVGHDAVEHGTLYDNITDTVKISGIPRTTGDVCCPFDIANDPPLLYAFKLGVEHELKTQADDRMRCALMRRRQFRDR